MLISVRAEALPTSQALEPENITLPDSQDEPFEQVPSLPLQEPQNDVLQIVPSLPSIEDPTGSNIDSQDIPVQGFRFQPIPNRDYTVDPNIITAFEEPQQELSEVALKAVKEILIREILRSYPEIEEIFIREVLRSYPEIEENTVREILRNYPERGDCSSEGLCISDSLKLTQLSEIYEIVKTQQIPELETIQEVMSRTDGSDFLEDSSEFKFAVPINLTFDNLVRVREAITQHYHNEGYINSFAFIRTGQIFSPEEGIVEISVVEGRLASCETRIRRAGRGLDIISGLIINPDDEEDFGNEGYDSYINARLTFYLQAVGVLHCSTTDDTNTNTDGTNTNPILNLNRLEEALRLLQQDPQVGRITARLEQDEERIYISRLRIDVEESAPPPVAQLQFDSDNSRSPSIGSIQLQPRLTLHPLRLFNNESRLQDRLDVAYTYTEGSDSFDISYFLPLSQNGISEALEVSYRTAYSQLLEEPFSALDIISYSQQVDIQYERLLSLSLIRQLRGELGISLQASDSSVAGFAIPLSEEADANGRTRTAIARGALTFTERTTQHALLLRPELSFGSNTSVNSGAFLIGRLDGQWVRRLGDILFLVRGRAQFATSDLPALEQFGIGGQQTVRGYRQNFLLTDNALLGSVEVRVPIFANSNSNSFLFLIPFFDFGTGWYHSSENNLSPSTLLSTGLGLQFELGDRFSARLDWGIPLVSVPNSGDSLQENGLYFSIGITPITW